MRADAARADRSHAVREAARGWRRAGAIDEATLNEIAAAYPDDRARLSLGLRALSGGASILGGSAMAVLLALLLEPRWPNGTVVFAGALAMLFIVATEIQTGPLRRAQSGAEYATAILAATSAGLAWASLSEDLSELWIGFGCAAAFALAAWRWGFALLGALAAALVLVACSNVAAGRALWFALGLAALPLILIAARSPRWPPALRRTFTFSGWVFLAGGYVATNLASLDRRWIGLIHNEANMSPSAWARRAAIAGTILMPPVVFGLGVRFRDRGLLAAGALFAAASLATLRLYQPIGPWWLALVLGGSACLVLAAALRRWLDAGAGGERSGFTAVPPFDDRRALTVVRAAATLVAMSPGPRASPDGGVEGGGGRSGGGGATGDA